MRGAAKCGQRTQRPRCGPFGRVTRETGGREGCSMDGRQGKLARLLLTCST